MYNGQFFFIFFYLYCILLTQVEPRVGCKDEIQQEHPTKEEQKNTSMIYL